MKTKLGPEGRKIVVDKDQLDDVLVQLRLAHADDRMLIVAMDNLQKVISEGAML